MIRISSETEMMDTFRPVDREEVDLPAGLKFPLVIKDYMAWVEPSGFRTFLVYEDPTSRDARGIVFRRSRPVGEPSVYMCEWCHRVSGGGAVGLLTAAAGSRHRIGLHLCRDLSCKDTIAAKPPSVNDLRESLNEQEKSSRLIRRISEFARRNLF
jgi:hypothetical protein